MRSCLYTMALSMSFQERVRDIKFLLGKLLPRAVSGSRKSLEEACEEVRPSIC